MTKFTTDRDVPCYKGAGFKSFFGALRKLRGQDAVDRTIDLLPSACAEAWRYQEIVAGGWYPLEWFRAMHAAAQEVTKEGPSLARTIAREAMRMDLSGIYRVLLIVVSPQVVIGKAARTFHLYYTHGSMQVIESRHGFARAVWENCKGFDGNLWNDTLASCEAGLELCGAKNLRIKFVRGGHDGDDSAEVLATWT